MFGRVQSVVKTSTLAGQISLSNIGVAGSEEYKDFVVDNTKPLLGDESVVSCNLIKIYGLDDGSEDYMPEDSAAQNAQIEVEADNFIDFTESNPFGDPF